MKQLESINDFVVRFATVNGSGSASANNLFAKAVFRMGVPVSPKNIFPSNIQGLPTWYEVRINERGHVGRRGDVDLVVAINGQTLRQDYDGLVPGGYFVYDSSRPLPEDFCRDDVTTVGIPMTTMCNEAFDNAKMRPLLKNIIYVGALAALLDMEPEVLVESLRKQFRKNPALAEPNIRALELGYAYARDHHAGACKLTVRRSDRVGDAIIMNGNNAAALGAIFAGATVVGWYPITPSTSIIEAFGRYAEQFRTEEGTGRIKAAIVQAEDELAAIGIVIGASWNGARAFTATSGPGISLMTEFLGLAYYAEIPAVLIDVQRVGPSTGMPTRTQQSDLLACAYASHGDTKHPLLFPCDPKECFDMTADAFDLAERLQTPVIVMSDLDLGMNDHYGPPLAWDPQRRYDRGKVLDAAQLDALTTRWGRYRDVDGDGICYRTYPGTHPDKGVYFTRGSSRDEYAAYTEDNAAYVRNLERLRLKWETAKRLLPLARIKLNDADARLGVVFYGSTTPAAYEAIELLRDRGIAVNSMRIRAFPFQREAFDFILAHELVFVIEQNRDGQMRTLLINEGGLPPDKLVPIASYDGLPVASRFLTRALEEALAERGVILPKNTPDRGGTP
ncbi:MAG: 2-oxoacid:acceptor oxidoreductase subunit alpha [Desulfobulbus sp.]|jgi:2-oxoglutarate ferredoxin oxidoreductase subunit alpha|uniref:2-oxoacid:acceptor oxidoreductase subunit alpha n=1 Tax=Desulfobulbus sp. TaxID=895 RepID=UPI00283F84DF|nr:2-oxoacid:acceptor oxidoreductase subunit alpha [Desulfobulbus sp.]MDR2549625.1 2-oxoacid:acceptor oxidoreductase subunit alpha [Desulfobulbus sp.]